MRERCGRRTEGGRLLGRGVEGALADEPNGSHDARAVEDQNVVLFGLFVERHFLSTSRRRRECA
jgi:hypothetical protein